jgi:hypothetical protein
VTGRQTGDWFLSIDWKMHLSRRKSEFSRPYDQNPFGSLACHREQRDGWTAGFYGRHIHGNWRYKSIDADEDLIWRKKITRLIFKKEPDAGILRTLTQSISDKVFTTLAVMMEKCLFLRRLKNARMQGSRNPEE